MLSALWLKKKKKVLRWNQLRFSLKKKKSFQLTGEGNTQFMVPGKTLWGCLEGKVHHSGHSSIFWAPLASTGHRNPVSYSKPAALVAQANRKKPVPCSIIYNMCACPQCTEAFSIYLESMCWKTKKNNIFKAVYEQIAWKSLKLVHLCHLS